MSIALGLNSLSNVKFADNQISSVYLGTNLVWSSYNYILDLYPSAHHAYSLRKLRSAYGGFCLRVRRTAITSTEVNVSFDSNNTISLNSPITYASGTATTATTLGQFAAIAGYGTPDAGVSANQNIFVVTWYDQSGNGKNPTNSTAGQQPRLVSSATADLERSGGKVAVRFTKASSQNLNLVDTTANINNMSSYWVGQFVTTVNNQVGYSLATANRFYFPYIAISNTFAAYNTSAIAIQLDAGVSTNRKLYELIAPSPLNITVAQGWTNGVAQGTRNIGNFATTNIQLGTAGTSYFDGYIQEVIGYQSNTNRQGKENNINSFWQIF